ncbi:MAG: hypothetical protein KAV82_09860 [Phycisphaerae bacterium]|nr:hypothetical protein [Phycisphaerae bacterium]
MFIGWDDGQRRRNLHRIVNNSRFLILKSHFEADPVRYAAG